MLDQIQVMRDLIKENQTLVMEVQQLRGAMSNGILKKICDKADKTYWVVVVLLIPTLIQLGIMIRTLIK